MVMSTSSPNLSVRAAACSLRCEPSHFAPGRPCSSAILGAATGAAEAPIATHAAKGGFDGGTLLVGHSGLRRVVMLLTGERQHGIPEGGVTVLKREAATGRWVVVEEISVEARDDDERFK